MSNLNQFQRDLNEQLRPEPMWPTLTFTLSLIFIGFIISFASMVLE